MPKIYKPSNPYPVGSPINRQIGTLKRKLGVKTGEDMIKKINEQRNAFPPTPPLDNNLTNKK